MDFDQFHHSELPGLLASGQGTAAAHALGAGPSLALRLPDGRAYTYRSTGADIEVCAGDDADVVAELGPDAFDDLLVEAWSVFGLLYGDRVTIRCGDFNAFVRWEAPLQALWFGRPIYGPDDVAALASVDVARSFRLDDDDEELRQFLAAAGFLVVRAVFTPDEVDELNRVVDAELVEATPGDRKSWWATRSDGAEVCCRLTYLAGRSPAVARLSEDPRLARIAALADERFIPCPDRQDGTSVVIKNPAVVAGLSDLPWHRDCGVGGHRILCPGLNVGIQLSRADAANGQLHYLAGSHHHAAQMAPPQSPPDAPTVAIDAEPGDVTVHYGHILHAAPPPTSPTAGRRALYVGYHLPALFAVVGPGQSYNDVLLKADAGRVRSPDEVVAAR